MTINRALPIVGILLAILIVCAVSFASMTRAADFPKESQRPIAYASTTAYTLVGNATASRIVATSTRTDATATTPATSGRTALTLQAINCGATASIWFQFNDLAATTSAGYWLNASSTVHFGDTSPMVYGSIRASASTANCTLLVTEYRSQP